MNVARALRKMEKDGPSPLYLVVGPEAYLRRGFLERLEAAVLGSEAEAPGAGAADTAGGAAGFGWGRQTRSGEGLTVNDLLADTMSVPLMGGPRFIVVKNWDLLGPGGPRGSRHDGEAFERLLQQLTDDTCLVFESEAVDRRRAITRRLIEHAAVVECDALRVGDIPPWLIRKARERGYRLSAPAASMLAELVGPDLQLLEMELDKVLLFAGRERSLGPDHVRAVASGDGQWRIFDVQDAIGARKPRRALEALTHLFDGGEPPLRALTMIARHMGSLWEARRLLNEGQNPAAIGAALGVPPFLARKYAGQARNFTLPDLSRNLEACHETDVAIKTGSRPPDLALEMLVLRLAHPGDS